MKTYIPYGQFLRMKWNASEESDYLPHAKRLSIQFKARGYPVGGIYAVEQRTRTRSTESLFLQHKSKENLRSRLSRAMDYTPRTTAIMKIIRRHWHLLREIPGCEKFPQTGPRKTRTLRSILVKSDMGRSRKKSSLPSGHFRCGKCNVCWVMWVTKKIDFVDIQLVHELSTFSNCQTKFVVYLLECACSLRYIGSTQLQLRVRIQEHIARIRNQIKEAPVVQHFLDKGHKADDLRVVVLEVVEAHAYVDWGRLLLQHEAYWIFQLGTLYPKGLNSELEFGVFL